MSDNAAPFFIVEDFDEANYTLILKSFHTHLRPKRYLEIGTQAGATLAIAGCASLAIDPHFVLDRNVITDKPICVLCQTTSDAFFSTSDPQIILGGPVDLAFLDGMHLFEYLLRDFMNTEAHCVRNSVIILHDCLPTDEHVARRDIHDTSLAHRSPHPGWWTGDVWKAAAIMLKYRPDLVIYGCKAAPTGLILITNLDPGSDMLKTGYFDIIDEFHPRHTSGELFQAYMTNLRMIPAAEFLSLSGLASRFWL